jgi:hypothetical protein
MLPSAKNTMRPLLKDNDLQKKLHENGVTKLTLLDKKKIQDLLSIFYDTHPNANNTTHNSYYFSIDGQGKEYKQEIFHKSYPILKPILNSAFQNFKITGIIFQIKGCGDKSNVNIHQDLTIVDESKHSALTVWIPLTKSTVENGAISFLHGSQHAFRTFRASTIDHYLFGQVEDFIKENSTIYEADEGEALVFDPAAIHFSGPNYTNKQRISIAISLVEIDAPVQIGFYDKNKSMTEIEMYKVPDEFWHLYRNFAEEKLQPPAFGTYTHTLKLDMVKEYDRKEFIDSYKSIKKLGS